MENVMFGLLFADIVLGNKCQNWVLEIQLLGVYMVNKNLSIAFVKEYDCKLLPKFRAGDVGIDFLLPNNIIIPSKKCVNIPLGICQIVVPNKHYLMLVPRSSALTKTNLIVITSIIDPSYTGEIHAQVYNPTDIDIHLKKYGSLVQGVIQPYCAISNIKLHAKYKEKTNSAIRGTGGFGSTGNSPI